jgi:large subunit ribosomal protein L9
MANAQVILREKIEGLGAEADVVKVRAGYARNYLVPQGKAFEATRAKREAAELEEAQALASKISKLRPKFTLEVGQGGRAFGSVTSLDIHKELEAAGIVIDRHAIELDKPVKKSGKTDVTVRVHPEVSVILTINVESNGTEQEEEA